MPLSEWFFLWEKGKQKVTPRANKTDRWRRWINFKGKISVNDPVSLDDRVDLGCLGQSQCKRASQQHCPWKTQFSHLVTDAALRPHSHFLTGYAWHSRSSCKRECWACNIDFKLRWRSSGESRNPTCGKLSPQCECKTQNKCWAAETTARPLRRR